MWQAASVLLHVNPAAMSMPIERFLRVPHSTDFTTILAITDAGPRIFDPVTNAELLHTSFHLPYDQAAEQPDYQNTRELNGGTLAMLCARIFGVQCNAPPFAGHRCDMGQ